MQSASSIRPKGASSSVGFSEVFHAIFHLGDYAWGLVALINRNAWILNGMRSISLGNVYLKNHGITLSIKPKIYDHLHENQYDVGCD